MSTRPPASPDPRSRPAAQQQVHAVARPRQILVLDPGTPEGEFDALTDLFLGEVARASQTREGPAAPVAPAPTPTPQSSDTQPRLRLTAHETDEWDSTPPPLPMPRTSAHEAAEPAPAPAEPIIECLILGHLPVFGAAWASQYVREIAQAARRPVAVLRLHSGYASVELVGVDDDLRQRMPRGISSIEAAMTAAASLTHRWIIRCEAGIEAEAAGHHLVRVVTLLTGGDEAAKVGAYASIKGLAEQIAAPTPDRPGPLMRLAVIGASPSAASATGERIAEAVRSFLKRDIERVVCSSRIDSNRPPVLLFSGPAGAPSGPLLDLLGRLTSPGPAAPVQNLAPPTAPLRDEAPATPITPPLHLEMEPDEEEAVSESVQAPPAPRENSKAMAAAPAAAAPMDPEASAPRAPIPAAQPSARPMSEPAPQARPRPADASLAAHIAGLRTLPIECPYAEGVEVALDAAGRLHLLARAEAGMEDAVSGLFVAAVWAEAHESLIALAIGTRPAGKSVLHVFTDEPKRSRRLLDTDIRLHLLARVDVGGQSGWFCTELN